METAVDLIVESEGDTGAGGNWGHTWYVKPLDWVGSGSEREKQGDPGTFHAHRRESQRESELRK